MKVALKMNVKKAIAVLNNKLAGQKIQFGSIGESGGNHVLWINGQCKPSLRKRRRIGIEWITSGKHIGHEQQSSTLYEKEDEQSVYPSSINIGLGNLPSHKRTKQN